jgi:hypothetical protein
MLGVPDPINPNGRSRNHPDSVSLTEHLSNQYRSMWSKMAEFHVNLRQIIATLQAKKIPFVLTGAYGIGGWTGNPRATHDVDILVKGGRNHARAIKALKELYPELEVHNFAGVAAFIVPGETKSVIDVTYPHRADIQVTLETAIWIEKQGQRYRIPTLEAALANKYGAMLALNRDPGKRMVDAADFYFMVKHSMEQGREPIDRVKLEALGEKVWPGGGGKEVLSLVDQVRAGGAPRLPEPKS